MTSASRLSLSGAQFPAVAEPSETPVQPHRRFTWLGKRYGNITFEDDSLDFDLSEIYSVFDDSEGDK